MEKNKSNLIQAGSLLMIVASVFFLIKIVAEFKGLRYIGGGPAAASTISFSGQGEVTAVPDIATVNLTIREEGANVAIAQDKVATKEEAVLEFLDEEGVLEKDIKTESYNSHPKYDYGAPCFNFPCPPQEQKIVGYEVSEYISVKIRDLDKVGAIVQGLGDLKISEVNGPNFAIEDEDELKSEARKMAIEEAKDKAESLADDLGVRLVRIVNFSEDGNYPMPLYGMGVMEAQKDSAVSAPAPRLPTGENKITSNVTITYEIR